MEHGFNLTLCVVEQFEQLLMCSGHDLAQTSQGSGISLTFAVYL